MHVCMYGMYVCVSRVQWIRGGLIAEQQILKGWKFCEHAIRCLYL